MSEDEPPDPCDQPLFIVGAERSGSTLLRLMLDHHPDIAVPFEFDFAIERVPEHDGWPDVADYLAWLSTERIFTSSGLRADPTLPYDALVRDFLRQKQAASGKRVIGAALHRCFDRIPRIWPRARFVHLVRDGRDVARSVVQMGWAGNVWTAIERWLTAEECWDRLRLQLKPGSWVEVRYCDLIHLPLESLEPICQLVGVPFNESMLEFHRDTSYPPLDSRLVEQWHHRLSRREIRLIEFRAGRMLADRGYRCSGLPPLSRRVAHLDGLWRLHSRAASSLARARQLGARVFLLEFLARRLRLRRWHAALLRGINRRKAQRLR